MLSPIIMLFRVHTGNVKIIHQNVQTFIGKPLQENVTHIWDVLYMYI